MLQQTPNRFQILFSALRVTNFRAAGFALCLVSSSMGAAGLLGQQASAGVTPFEDGDRVVFVGDSITHGGSYHTNVALFYATRFPERGLRFYNAGISGDTAVGTVKRFDEDIAIHKPTVATIMLGMNDVGRALYTKPAETPEAKAEFSSKQAAIRTRYLDHMTQLAESLKGMGSEVIFISPSIFDETAAVEKQNSPGANDELAVYGQALKELSAGYGGQVIDFQTPMLEVNQALQAKDPSASVVGPDRVHPGPAGHLVMAYAFLKAQAMPKAVTTFVIDAQTNTTVVSDNCIPEPKLYTEEGLIAFTWLAQALPFPVAKSQAAALDWVPFQEELNQQFFQVLNFPEDSLHRLTIDGVEIGEYTGAQLQAGINLAEIHHTPMYRQALKVKALNDQRAAVSGKLRSIAHVRHSMLSKYPDVDLADKQAVAEVLAKHIEASQGKSWHGYLKRQVANYLEHAEHEQAYRQQIEELFEKIQVANKPIENTWFIEEL